MGSAIGRLLSRKRRKYLAIVLFIGALLAVWDVNHRRGAHLDDSSWNEAAGEGLEVGGSKSKGIWPEINLDRFKPKWGSTAVEEDDDDLFVDDEPGELATFSPLLPHSFPFCQLEPLRDPAYSLRTFLSLSRGPSQPYNPLPSRLNRLRSSRCREWSPLRRPLLTSRQTSYLPAHHRRKGRVGHQGR